MGIVEKLKKSGRGDTGVREFCVQTIRFKKLLENGRGLLDLFADGREKVRGEYIFDRHYVISLIDGVVDRLGMMVYDASVLVPESGEAFYAVYDRQKSLARRLIEATASGAQSGLGGSKASEISDSDDPEFRLLSEALQWFHGKGSPGEMTVMEQMKQVFSLVVRSLSPADVLKQDCFLAAAEMTPALPAMAVVDLWKDARALPGKRRKLSDINSLPLRHLLLEAAGGHGGSAGRQTGGAGPDWIAAVSENQLSLQSLRSGVRLRLETLASGYESSDFIFVFTDRPSVLDRLLPRGFHREDANDGQFAWSLDMSVNDIEDTLMFIGRNLFDERIWSSGK